MRITDSICTVLNKILTNAKKLDIKQIITFSKINFIVIEKADL